MFFTVVRDREERDLYQSHAQRANELPVSVAHAGGSLMPLLAV